MITAVALAVAWVVLAVPFGVLFGRIMRAGGVTVAEYRAEPDWLWKKPTDSLSDAAVGARFADIVAHFRVLS